MKRFNYWHLLVDGIIVVFVFAASAYVRDVVSQELKAVVTQEEFTEYKSTHNQWSNEVLKNINGKLQVLDVNTERALDISRENNAMLRELRAELKTMRVGLDRSVPGFAQTSRTR